MDYSLKDYLKIIEAIKTIDSDKKDCTITMKEYQNIQSDKNVCKVLSGGLTLSEWKGFKEKLISNLSQWGFEWKSLQGQGGPIALVNCAIPKEVGSDIAKKNFDLMEEGDFYTVIKDELKALFDLFENENQIDYSAARDGFVEYKHNNKGYKFKRGRSSTSFYKSIADFVYGSEAKIQDEVLLGEKILPLLKAKLNIELEHTQEKRAAGKFQNIDFIGYKIENDLTFDRISIYAFELKASNKIASISEAISQAINYKAVSNYSYIIIPMFDEGIFIDDSRFKTYVQLCSTNNIGIVTILFNEKTNEPESVYEVLPAVYNEVIDKATILTFLKEHNYEVCPLCRKIVNKETRKGCDWLVSVGSNDKANDICMKKLMEEKYARDLI